MNHFIIFSYTPILYYYLISTITYNYNVIIALYSITQYYGGYRKIKKYKKLFIKWSIYRISFVGCDDWNWQCPIKTVQPILNRSIRKLSQWNPKLCLRQSVLDLYYQVIVNHIESSP